MDEPILQAPDPRMVKALALVADGRSYRYSARECDIPHTTLYDHAKRTGVAERVGRELVPLSTIQADIEEARKEATRQLSEALRSGEIKPSQLPTTVGILTDKALRIAEISLRNPSGASSIDRIAEAIDHLLEQGAKATLTLEPVRPEEQAIDVTPVESETD